MRPELDFERYENFYNKLVEGCDTKEEMNQLLRNSIYENMIRIDELEILRKDFCTSGKTNTRISYRINKILWANEKIRIKNL